MTQSGALCLTTRRDGSGLECQLGFADILKKDGSCGPEDALFMTHRLTGNFFQAPLKLHQHITI